MYQLKSKIGKKICSYLRRRKTPATLFEIRKNLKDVNPNSIPRILTRLSDRGIVNRFTGRHPSTGDRVIWMYDLDN